MTGRTAPPAVIEAEKVGVRFGGVRALHDVTLTVARGETVAVVGPNGAGKSTLLSLFAGTLAPSSGRLVVAGRTLTARQGHRMARAGVGLAHQVPKPFGKLSVRENLEVAAQVLRGRAERRRAVRDSLEHTGLAVRADRLSGSLGLLDLKRLELARALALRPRLLLLDEVAAGLNGEDLGTLIGLLRDLRGSVPTMVLVEHVQDVVHELAERVIVLEWGKKIAEGTPAEISRDARVIESYLGTSGAAPASTAAARTTRETVLRAVGLRVAYGHVEALAGVTCSVAAGEIVGVLGANGAGKTTLAKALMGAVPARSGRVTLAGEDVSALAPHERVNRGITLCPEGRRLFPALTVAANLELGLGRSRDRSRLEAAYELFPMLAELRFRRAGALSGGEQQMVAIGRALASDPRVVVLDEVSLGLAPVIVDRLYEAILTIRSWGTAVIMVEQNVRRALAVADRVLLLRQGRPVFWGAPADLGEDEFHRAYLGPDSGRVPAPGPTSVAETEKAEK